MNDKYLKELRKPKPFSGLADTELLNQAAEIITQLPETLEEAQFNRLLEPLSYIWGNLGTENRTALNKMLTAHCSGLQVIFWLPKVKAIIEKQSYKKTKGGHGHVYFILLDRTQFKTTSTNCGIYIGQSKYTPDRRFKNHLSGRHASRVVRDYGKFVLQSLSYNFVPISRKESIRLEAHLLKELREANFINLPAKIIKGS